MANKKKIPIDYTSRDFASIREDLLSYIKRYYPNTYKDFNEASFGSLMVDTVSYVGDILSFYLDYQANESFMDTALEYDNVIRHARQMGYKFGNAPVSYGSCSFYILVPASASSVLPDRRYIPTLRRGTKMTTPGGVVFTLTENVNFAHPDNEIVVAKVDANSSPTFYAIKAKGVVVSGELLEHTVEIDDFRRFLKVEVPGQNVTEIVSVFDADGNQYYEVDYLSQNVVFKEIVNRDQNTDTVASVLKPFATPRRFVTEYDAGTTYLQFGYGSEEELKTSSVADPSDLVLKVHGKNYVTNTLFDPAKLTRTDKFGVVPSNTSLFIIYRVNTNDNVNVGAKTIKKITDPTLYFQDRINLRPDIIDVIVKSIEVTNEEPITGDITLPSTEEIKRRAVDYFATQNRAVTKQDYVAAVYAMPSKFGAVKRCTVQRDNNDLKRNLNIYVVSENVDATLTATNAAIKNNLKTWLNNMRMVGDTIDILPAKIVNLGIEFEVIAESTENKYSVLNKATAAIVEDMLTTHREIGEPFYITDVFKSLKDVEGLLDVVDVRVVNKTSGRYSDVYPNLEKLTSSDGRFITMPKDHVWEIKYPFVDIVGVVM